MSTATRSGQAQDIGVPKKPSATGHSNLANSNLPVLQQSSYEGGSGSGPHGRANEFLFRSVVQPKAQPGSITSDLIRTQQLRN